MAICIVNATLTPDYKTPSVASYVQAKLSLKNIGALDINVASAEFTYELNITNGLVTYGQNKKVLVIGSDGDKLHNLYCEELSESMFDEYL